VEVRDGRTIAAKCDPVSTVDRSRSDQMERINEKDPRFLRCAVRAPRGILEVVVVLMQSTKDAADCGDKWATPVALLRHFLLLLCGYVEMPHTTFADAFLARYLLLNI
jgi:hypothetical protein